MPVADVIGLTGLAATGGGQAGGGEIIGVDAIGVGGLAGFDDGDLPPDALHGQTAGAIDAGNPKNHAGRAGAPAPVPQG